MAENATLWKGMWLDIFLEMPAEKAAIRSWMYIRKVSDDQRPIFLMVLSEAPLRCIAIAPPARRLWLLTSIGLMPCKWRPTSGIAYRIAFVMSEAWMAWGTPLMKTVPSMVFLSDVCARMCLTRRMRALEG